MDNLDLNKLAELMENLEQNIDEEKLKKIKALIEDENIKQEDLEEFAKFIKNFLGNIDKN